MEIPILYQDEHLLVVNKPAGLAVHRSKMTAAESAFLIDELHQQVSGKLFLAHRLDRATSGVVLLARDAQTAGLLGQQFMDRSVRKVYLAIVRGWPEPTHGVIDYPLCGGRKHSAPKPAITHYQRLACCEVAVALGRYPTQRYALLSLQPETGRWRQLRQHLHHISHHLIGDTSHGRGDHNRLFKQHFGAQRMFLHASSLQFTHPNGAEAIKISAPLDLQWQNTLSALGWNHSYFAHAFSAALGQRRQQLLQGSN